MCIRDRSRGGAGPVQEALDDPRISADRATAETVVEEAAILVLAGRPAGERERKLRDCSGAPCESVRRRGPDRADAGDQRGRRVMSASVRGSDALNGNRGKTLGRTAFF